MQRTYYVMHLQTAMYRSVFTQHSIGIAQIYHKELGVVSQSSFHERITTTNYYFSTDLKTVNKHVSYQPELLDLAEEPASFGIDVPSGGVGAG